MSDHRVRAALEQLEGWMVDPTWEPDPEQLRAWNAEYQAVLAQAEKGAGWPELVARAHLLGQQLEVRLAQLTRVRDAVRAELDAQERGSRALLGYGASTR